MVNNDIEINKLFDAISDLMVKDSSTDLRASQR